MTEISASVVKQLRDATNVSMMECKRALVEAGGDPEKATRLLRERGMAVAAKKAGRAANQGLVASATAKDRHAASLVEVNCETDFVARNPDFQRFVAEVAERALATDGSLAELLKNEVTAKVVSIGENILLRRNLRFVRQGTGVVASYIHLGGKVGVLVELGCEKPATADHPAFIELAKDLTLHVAAASPRYLASRDVEPAVLQQEREIYAKQVEGKPPQIVEKIVDGKIKRFYADVCLVDQAYVREPKMSISQLVSGKAAELKDNIAIRRFVRFQLGEQ